MNEIIADEKDIKDETFRKYFDYQNLPCLVKDIIRAKQAKHEQLVNNINDELIDSRSRIIKNKILQNENPDKIVDIVEQVLDCYKQQENLTPKHKHLLQRLPIAVPQKK